MFTSKTEFCLHIEKIKTDEGFDTYIEAVIFFVETKTDLTYDAVRKMLNDKIIENITVEANNANLLKSKVEIVTL